MTYFRIGDRVRIKGYKPAATVYCAEGTGPHANYHLLYDSGVHSPYPFYACELELISRAPVSDPPRSGRLMV